MFELHDLALKWRERRSNPPPVDHAQGFIEHAIDAAAKEGIEPWEIDDDEWSAAALIIGVSEDDIPEFVEDVASYLGSPMKVRKR